MNSNPPIPAPKKKRKGCCLGSVIAGIVVLAAVGVALYKGPLRPDAPPVDDSDLLPQWTEVPEEENSFELLEAAAGLGHMSKEDNPEVREHYTRVFESKDYGSEDTRQFVESRREAFAALDRALERPSLRVRRAARFADPLPANYNGIIDLMKSLKVSALHQSEKGNFDGVIVEVKRMTSLCELLHEGEGSLIHALVAISAKTITDKAIEEVADGIEDGHQRYAAELQQIAAGRRNLRECMKFSFSVEYLTQKNMVIGIRDGRISSVGGGKLPGTSAGRSTPTFIFKPNETIQRYAEFYRNEIAVLESGEFGRKAETSTVERPPDDKIKAVLTGNLIGEMLLDVSLPVYDGVQEQVLIGELATQLVILKLALRRYELDHGSLPDSLDALVPDYLEAVPVDPYDGKPLRYSKEGRFVYSVGIDLVDGGGSPEEKLGPDVPDPTIKLVGYGE